MHCTFPRAQQSGTLRYVTYWQYLRTVPGPGAVLPLTFGNGAGITVYRLSGPQSSVSVVTVICLVASSWI